MAVHALPVKPVIRRSLAEAPPGCPRFPMEDSERLAFGQAFHTYAASYILHCQALGEESDLTAVFELARDAWARTRGLNQERCIQPQDGSRDAEFFDLCHRFSEANLAGLDTLQHVEHTLTYDVGFPLLTCTLDRLDRVDAGDPDDDPTWLLVRDWKTELGEMEHGFQIRWYTQMLFLTQPGLQNVDFEVVPVRRGRPYDAITFQRGDLETWWNMVMQALQEVLESPMAPPYGGAQCENC